MLQIVPEVANLIAIGFVAFSFMVLVILSAAVVTRQFRWFGYSGMDQD